MRVLEINGFSPWARDYEGAHEVVRWLKPMEGKQGRGVGMWIRELVRGIGLYARIPKMEFDVVVCRNFGTAYRKSAPFRWLKSSWERFLIRCICALVKRSRAPLAIVETCDDRALNPINKRLLRCATRYFKRELPLDTFEALDSLRGSYGRWQLRIWRLYARRKGLDAKFAPMALGCREIEPQRDPIPVEEKEWDVFYAGNDEVKPCREGIAEAVQELARRGYAVRFQETPLSTADYLDAMANSRLALSPPGFGWDCHRNYEAAMVGTVPVTSYPTIQRHCPLLNGEHCFFYDPGVDLADQLEAFLADRAQLAKISTAAWKHSRQHHTFRSLFHAVVTTTVKSAKLESAKPAPQP